MTEEMLVSPREVMLASEPPFNLAPMMLVSPCEAMMMSPFSDLRLARMLVREELPLPEDLETENPFLDEDSEVKEVF